MGTNWTGPDRKGVIKIGTRAEKGWTRMLLRVGERTGNSSSHLFPHTSPPQHLSRYYLFVRHGQVDDRPADDARVELAELLKVERPDLRQGEEV